MSLQFVFSNRGVLLNREQGELTLVRPRRNTLELQARQSQVRKKNSTRFRRKVPIFTCCPPPFRGKTEQERQTGRDKSKANQPIARQDKSFLREKTMETDLESFLSPSGSLLGEVTQRVLGFLSVQDLVQYVATSSSTTGSAHREPTEPLSPDDLRYQRSPSRGRGFGGPGTPSPTRYRVGTRGLETLEIQRARFYRETGRPSPEEELPHEYDEESYGLRRGKGGDAAGGSSRGASRCYPGRSGDGHRRRKRFMTREVAYDDDDDGEENEEGEDHRKDEEEGGCWVNDGGERRRRGVSDGQLFMSSSKGGARIAPNAQVIVVGGGGGGKEDETQHQQRSPPDGDDDKKTTSLCDEKPNPGVLGVLVGLGLRPWTAFGAIGGGVVHLLSGVPLLALLRWATGKASALLGMTFKVALLPYDITKGAVAHVVGSVEAMLKIATEVRRLCRLPV